MEQEENKAIAGDRQVRARLAGGDSGIHKMLAAGHWTSLRKGNEGSSHCYVDLRPGDSSQYLGYVYRVEKPHCRSR